MAYKATPGAGIMGPQKDFSRVPSNPIQRSVFNRSHGIKTTFDAGALVPIFVDEVLPADTCKVRMNLFSRLATPIKALMDNLYLTVHFFFVPSRLLWDDWDKFNGAQDNPDDSTDYLLPNVLWPAGGWPELSLGDYFGLPTKVEIGVTALPFRAYNLIWNEWYRDQNLQDSVEVRTDAGPDTPNLYTVLRRNKRHDYFTSALPFPQKGPEVLLPLGSDAPIIGEIQSIAAPQFATATNPGNVLETDNVAGTVQLRGGGVSGQEIRWADPALDITNLRTDLANATAATVNSLRESFQIQRMFEKDARGGTRLPELIKSHFGVMPPDYRLQRPEFLGGGNITIRVNPVSATAFTSDASGGRLGDQGGFGVGIGSAGFTKSFNEHGYVIGLVSARADLNYQQGVERMWTRSNRFDFYWPSFAHLGEQKVLNKEIYAQGFAQAEADDGTWGYQQRYAEYQYKPSRITGLFRSNAATPLDFWHLAQDFDSLPLLNGSFIEENPPVDRVVITPEEPDFLLDGWCQYSHARPMPAFAVPGLIDHF